MGAKHDVLNMEPLADKWKAFNWDVVEIDGHHYNQISKALSRKKTNKQKPLVIIARTTKGKGVSFFEGKLEWHYKNVDQENYQKALTELHQHEG